MTPAEGLAALERVLDGGWAQVAVLPLDVRQWVDSYPAAASSSLLSRLIAAARGGAAARRSDPDLVARLASADDGERSAIVRDVVRAEVSRALRMAEAKVDADAPFTTLGMDSLMSLEIRNRIEGALGMVVPATLLWTYPTLARLSAHLARELAPAAPRAEDARVATPPVADEVAEMVTRMDDDRLMAFIDGLIDRAKDDRAMDEVAP